MNNDTDVDKLIDMPLFSETDTYIENGEDEMVSILRVPGGWIYRFYEINDVDGRTFTSSCAFVPLPAKL